MSIEAGSEEVHPAIRKAERNPAGRVCGIPAFPGKRNAKALLEFVNVEASAGVFP